MQGVIEEQSLVWYGRNYYNRIDVQQHKTNVCKVYETDPFEKDKQQSKERNEYRQKRYEQSYPPLPQTQQ